MNSGDDDDDGDGIGEDSEGCVFLPSSKSTCVVTVRCTDDGGTENEHDAEEGLVVLPTVSFSSVLKPKNDVRMRM